MLPDPERHNGKGRKGMEEKTCIDRNGFVRVICPCNLLRQGQPILVQSEQSKSIFEEAVSVHTNNKGIKLLAILLAVMLTVPVSIVAFAEGTTEPVTVYNDSVTINGDVTVTLAEDTEAAVNVFSGEGREASVTVNGDITAAGEIEYAKGINASTNGGTTTVTAGDVTVDGLFHPDGIVAYSMDGQVTVTAGDVHAESGEGVYVDAGNGGIAAVTTGDVTAEDIGVYVYTSTYGESDDNSVTVTTGEIDADRAVVLEPRAGEVTVETGNVTAGSDGISIWEDPDQRGYEITEEEFKPTSEECDYSSYRETDDGYGIDEIFYAEDGTHLVRTTWYHSDGTVDVSYSREETADSAGDANVTVGGDLTVTGEDASFAVRGYASVEDAQFTVNVEGNAVSDKNGTDLETSHGADGTLVVDGDLTAKDGEAIHIETFEDGSLSVEVGGDVNAGRKAENGESYTGIYAGSYGDGTNDISIGGDVNITYSEEKDPEEEESWREVTGIKLSGYEGVTGTTNIDGNINMVSDGGANALSVYAAGEGSSQTVTVAGDVNLDTAESVYGSTGVVVNTGNWAGTEFKAGDDMPEISVEIGGDINTSAGGAYGVTLYNMAGDIDVTVGGSVTGRVSVMNDASQKEINLDNDPGVDPGTDELWGWNDDGPYYYSREHDCYYNEDMTRFWTYESFYCAGSNTVEIGGDIDADGDVWVLGMQAYNRGEDFETTVNVGGSITANGTGSVYGAEYHAEGGKASGQIGGDVTADGATYTVGLQASADGGADVEVELQGDASAVQENAADADKDFVGSAEAVNLTSYGAGSTLKVTVVGNASAEADGIARGVSIGAYTNGSLETAINGDITAEGNENSLGIVIYNHDGGTVDAEFAGSVTSSGTGLKLEDYDWGSWVDTDKELEMIESEYCMSWTDTDDEGNSIPVKCYKHVEGGETYYYTDHGDKWIVEKTEDLKGGESNVTIYGNVTAEVTGLDFNMNNDKSTADIIVDGTVAGGEHAVLLTEETILDNITLTVWELKPNEECNVAEYYHTVEDSEGETSQVIGDAAGQFEKQIQYIIRMEQPDIGSFGVDGTRDYEGYDVANEGDTITLKIDVPYGYRVVGAYNGTDTKVDLLMNDKGEYYLVVPKGGAVLLSIQLEYDMPVQNNDTDESQQAVENAVAEEDVSVTVETDAATNQKIVVITPEEGATQVSVAIDAATINTLSNDNTAVIRVQSSDGSASVDLRVDELQQILNDAEPGAQLIIETDGEFELPEEIQSKVEAKYEILEGATDIIKIVLRDVDGEETELEDLDITLKMDVPYTEGMIWIFVSESGEITELEAEWEEPTETADGYWKVPYVGYGSYIPVIVKE